LGLEGHLFGVILEVFVGQEGAAVAHLGRHTPTTAPGVGAAITPQLQDAPSLVPMHADAIVLEATPPKSPVPEPQAPLSQHPEARGPAQWIHEAELELKKIPFFVRGKARRNTERYALEKGLFVITVETLYDAKAHFGR